MNPAFPSDFNSPPFNPTQNPTDNEQRTGTTRQPPSQQRNVMSYAGGLPNVSYQNPHASSIPTYYVYHQQPLSYAGPHAMSQPQMMPMVLAPGMHQVYNAPGGHSQYNSQDSFMGMVGQSNEHQSRRVPSFSPFVRSDQQQLQQQSLQSQAAGATYQPGPISPTAYSAMSPSMMGHILDPRTSPQYKPDAGPSNPYSQPHAARNIFNSALPSNIFPPPPHMAYGAERVAVGDFLSDSDTLSDPSQDGRERMTTTRQRRGGRNQTIPRPANSFIRYRTDRHAEVLARYEGMSNCDLSKIIAKMWADESPDVREAYQKLAKEGRAAHKAKYPDYKYAPRKEWEIARRPGRKGRTFPQYLTTPVGGGLQNQQPSPQHQFNNPSSPSEEDLSSPISPVASGNLMTQLAQGYVVHDPSMLNNSDPSLASFYGNQHQAP